MLYKTVLISLASLLIVLSACSTTSVMEIDGNADGTSVVNKKDSSVDAKVINVNIRKINDILQVSAQVESESSSPCNIEYKFFWFDSAGMPVDSSSTSWIPLYLNGRATAPVTGLAPNPAASTFKIQIKNAD